MSTKTQENQDFQIKPLSQDDWSFLSALADNKNVKITTWIDGNYKYYSFRTLDNKRELAKLKKEPYHPLKHIYRYSIFLGNGVLIAQGNIGKSSESLESDVDVLATKLCEHLRNKEIMKHISKCTDVRATAGISKVFQNQK